VKLLTDTQTDRQMLGET